MILNQLNHRVVAVGYVMPKKPLVEGIKEKCKVQIKTSYQEDDYMDVDLTITFLDGTLKGMSYYLTIDLQDYKEVGW